MVSSGNRSETLAAGSGGRGRRSPAGQPEYQRAVRSILPLMQELAGYLAPDGRVGKDHNGKIYGSLSQALLTLAAAARAARMEQQRQLFEEFQLLLENLRFGAWSRQSELPGLMVDFLHFLEAMHRCGDAENSSTARRIRDKLRNFHMLSALLKQQLAEALRYKEQQEEPEVVEAAFVKRRPLKEELSATRPGKAGLLRDRPEDFEELQGMEDDLAAARDAMAKVLEEFSDTLQDLNRAKDTLRRKSQEMATGLAVTSLSLFKSQPGEETTARGSMEFDPIELDRCLRLDLLIKSFNDISVDFNGVYATLTTLTGDIGGQLCRQQLTLRLLQDKLSRIRMAPLSAFSQALWQTVRESARKLNTQVNLVIGDEDVFLDRFVWARVSASLIHILNNAVNHGIEPSEKRVAAGKPEIGTIHVEAEQRSRSVILRITDDGSGIDLERIREKISSGGAFDNQHPHGEKELLEYLFSPNFAARTDIGTMSGRAIGLDAVRRNIQELGGAVRVFTTPGQGASFEVEIPCIVSVNRAVMVAVTGKVFAIPLQDIKQVKWFGLEELDLREGLFIRMGDDRIPVVNLGYCLQLEERTSELPTGDTGLVAILFNQGDRQLAVSVSEVIDQCQIIVKSLGSHLSHVPGVSGVTVTGHGVPIPILNLRELIGRR